MKVEINSEIHFTKMKQEIYDIYNRVKKVAKAKIVRQEVHLINEGFI